ncbi:PA domain-containing protein, partial [Streptomyces sp. NRRL F-3273]|uniref:PA domain-containing protein n=1 Tax=Streptomyces sp. NRRL F-3273 TaxID=1463848 RepID=UPI0005167E45
AEDSEQKLTGVFAGNGAAADYQGRAVKGKAVVVTRSDTVPPAERLANALAAGAKALFVVNDARGVAMESYAPYGEETTIPVASVRKGAGGTLIEAARHGRKLSVDQRKFASYVYDLVDRHDGTVPDEP